MAATVDDFKSESGLWKTGVEINKVRFYTRAGALHHAVLKRVKNPSGAARMYKNCEISSEFMDFQFFVDWCHNQVGYFNNEDNGRSWSIDKDIIFKGNGVYGPSQCCFVPQRINTLFPKRPDKRSELPVGVHFDGRYFVARSNDIDGNRKNLGSYKTPENAFEAYRKFKKSVIVQVAMMYKGSIDQRVFESLMSWEIDWNYNHSLS